MDDVQAIEVTVSDLDGARADPIQASVAPPVPAQPSAAPPIPPGVPNDSQEVIVEDLGAARTESTGIRIMQETTAKYVAYIIVGTFAGTILITLIICLGILWKSGDPQRVKLFGEAVLQVYDGVGKFIPTVFGSLLAFILGYYFSKEQKK
jgi:hypothetical protein